MIQMTKSGMKKFKAKSLYGALLAGGMMNSEAATSFYFEALTPYLGFNDSPFKPLVDAGEFENWVFEDFQDNTVSFPAGVAVSGYTIFSGGIGSLSDSVEFTGDVLTGRSLFGSGVFAMSFEEGPGNLSALPTHAGLVWTDGQTSLITFEAFDRDEIRWGQFRGIMPMVLFSGPRGRIVFMEFFIPKEFPGLRSIHPGLPKNWITFSSVLPVVCLNRVSPCLGWYR